MNNQNEIAGVPLNRIVAFVGPYVATLSGIAAAWLLVHVHFLGLFHLQQDGLATGIAQGVIFLLVTLITWLSHQKWLTGHQKWEAITSGQNSGQSTPVVGSTGSTWGNWKPGYTDTMVQHGKSGDLDDVPTDPSGSLGGDDPITGPDEAGIGAGLLHLPTTDSDQVPADEGDVGHE